MSPNAEPHLVVEATRDGRPVTGFDAGHGDDLLGRLWEEGYVAQGLPRIRTVAQPWTLHFVWPVRPKSAGDPRPDFLERDPSVSDADLATAVQRLRPAAYGLIGSARGVLLTELSERTSAPGWWNVPGGGMDPGEDPETALVREVHEETGQTISDIRLFDVRIRRQIARAPDGVVDYHSIRIFHRAWCLEPTDPVVHDVGGSTSRAAWVAPADLSAIPIAPSLRLVVEDFVTRTWPTG